MPRTASKTDRDALRFLRALSLLIAAWGGLRLIVRPHSTFAWLLGGAGLLLLSLATPAVVVPPARILFRALKAVGDAVSTVLLTILYLVLIWPWRGLLRMAGAIEPAEEPWPPPDASGWLPVGASSEGLTRQARPGSWLAAIAVHLGGSVALLRFIGRRPSAFIVPVLAILFLLAAIALAGNTTGLGPLIYTLF